MTRGDLACWHVPALLLYAALVCATCLLAVSTARDQTKPHSDQEETAMGSRFDRWRLRLAGSIVAHLHVIICAFLFVLPALRLLFITLHPLQGPKAVSHSTLEQGSRLF